MILVIDNYDSFVYNLVQYVGELDSEILVVRNDKLTLADVGRLGSTHIILSPGPRRPEDAGISVDLVKQYRGTIPILGVCLGHQAIVSALGGRVVSAQTVRHGKTSRIEHNGDGIHAHVPSPFEATRYHSLTADARSLPGDLRVTATAIDDSEIMAVEDESSALYGVQYHPESIATAGGKQIIRNFVEIT